MTVYIKNKIFHPVQFFLFRLVLTPATWCLNQTTVTMLYAVTFATQDIMPTPPAAQYLREYYLTSQEIFF